MKIVCRQNQGYHWTEKDGSFFKGYLQELESGETIMGEAAIDYFAKEKSFSDFTRALKRIQGLFAVILKTEDGYWFAVDHILSFPLYYSKDASIISDSAEAIRKIKGINRTEYNPLRILEIYESCYVAHQRTTYDEILSVQCGEAVCIKDGRVHTEPYYTHMQPVMNRTRQEALEELDQIVKRVVSDTLKAIGNRRIVLSLSGGYDSRFLACALKRGGVDDVICYCYGQKDSYEAVESRKVAQALGYEWHFVEYTDGEFDKVLHTYADYSRYVANHDNVPHNQTLLAVKVLKERGVLPDEAVFLTGLVNDSPSGVYVPSREQLKTYSYTCEGVMDYILQQRFYRIPIRDSVKEEFKKDIRDYLERRNIRVYDYQSFVGAFDALNYIYSHSKLFLGMHRAFDYFGYQWLPPWMDKRLLEFWYSVDADMRIRQGLFESYLLEKLLPAYGLARKKTTISVTAKNRRIKYIAANLAARLSWPLGIPLKRKSDVKNIAYFELRLYKHIKQKGALFDRRESIRTVIQTEYLENIYGTGWYKKIKAYFA